jgi:hypothetical protein
MTHIAGKASKDDSPILHAAIGLAPQIRAASEEIEQGRHIPRPLAAAMKEAGVFGTVMPRAWGGPELDPMTQFRVIEALAMEDGSVGWCAMIGCDAGYISAFLDQDAEAVLGRDELVVHSDSRCCRYRATQSYTRCRESRIDRGAPGIAAFRERRSR